MKAKLGDYLLWKDEPAKIIGTTDRSVVIIEMLKHQVCDKCGNDMGVHQFSVIPTSPLFEENAKPMQTLTT